MKPFPESSYLAQVRRLRALAMDALKHYPLRLKSLEFIHHGENTTFKATARDSRKYLVRVHRDDYHRPEGILEELKWIQRIHRQGAAPVAKPLPSRSGKLLVQATAPGVPGRRPVSVLHWLEGRFLHRRSSRSYLYDLGRLIAILQKAAPKTRNRRYWTAEGMVGHAPKFGSIDHLALTTPAQQKVITAARKKTLGRLRLYERRFPKRFGLIHADIHFGNLLVTDKGLAAIDFDDCGYGFWAYDLAVVMLAIERQFNERDPVKVADMRKRLIAGYKTVSPWDHHDDAVLDDLILARKLMMLGWLNSRADNPRLAKHYKKTLPQVVKKMRRRL